MFPKFVFFSKFYTGRMNVLYITLEKGFYLIHIFSSIALQLLPPD